MTTIQSTQSVDSKGGFWPANISENQARTERGKRGFAKRNKRACCSYACILSSFLLLVLVGYNLIFPYEPISIASLAQMRTVEALTNRTFRVLCTSSEEVREWWFSYQIRCKDFRTFTAKYFPAVAIDIIDAQEAVGIYDATVMIKYLVDLPERNSNSYGRIYVDVLDNFLLHDSASSIPPDFEIIVQNRFQQKIFSRHKTHIVPHWFNSFPADDKMEPWGALPEIEPTEILKIATIWNPQEHEKSYMSIDRLRDVRYDKIDKGWGIQSWYLSYVNDTADHVKQIMANPQLGHGFLYQTLFRQYHALVVYPKQGHKLTFGPVHRVVSQMRSGVPVLLDCRGPSHGDFCQTYEYPCTFTDEDTFVAMVKRMKSVELRKECQRVGIEITKDFTPRAVVAIYLKALGFDVESIELSY